jgi:hypothetical protein
MDVRKLWKPVVLYTCIFGLLTVGAVYLGTRSGVAMIALVGFGVLLVAAAGGAASMTSTGALDHADDSQLPLSETGVSSHISTDTSLRVDVLCYGVGVLLWSVVVLTTLRDTLV